jgi:hypothetical protein
MRRALVATLIALSLVALGPSGKLAAKATVVKRIGNNTEGATLVSNGPGEAQIALLDGYDVLVMPAGGNSKAPAHRIFDVKSHQWTGFPSGIAFLGVEKNFVFDDQGSFNELVVFNAGGHPLPSRPIQYLPGTPAVIATEGMVYLGADTAFPDSLARAVWFEDFTPSIEIMTRAGVVLREIPVGSPVDYITGLTYLSSGAFLVSNASANIWTVALDGTVTAGPAEVAQAGDLEAVVALADGRVYASDYSAGTLFAFDASLGRQPSLDRSYAIGVGLSRGFDAVWDPQTGGLIINGLGREFLQAETAVVSPRLDAKETLFQHVDTFGLTMLGDGSLATCRIFRPPSVLHYSRSGALLDVMSLATIDGLPLRCRVVTYLSSIDAYALVFSGFTQRRRVYLVSRDGVYLTSFDAPADIDAMSVEPGGAGDRLLVWSRPQLRTYDLSGVLQTGEHALLSTRTLDTGSLRAPSGFASLPGGGYAVLDPNNSEVAIF